MAPRAIAGIDLRAVGVVAQRALLGDALMRRTDMEWLVAPVGVTTGGCAGL